MITVPLASTAEIALLTDRQAVAGVKQSLLLSPAMLT